VAVVAALRKDRLNIADKIDRTIGWLGQGRLLGRFSGWDDGDRQSCECRGENDQKS